MWSSQDWTVFLEFISMHLSYFPPLRSRYRIGILLGAAKISIIFWGMPDIPDICGGSQ